MSATRNPAAAQLAALRLRAAGPIRVTLHGIGLRRATGRWAPEGTTWRALADCVLAGLLTRKGDDDGPGARWEFTDEGRAALAAAGGAK